MDTQSQRRSTWKDTLASLFKRRRTNERGNSLAGKVQVFLRKPQNFDEIFCCKLQLTFVETFRKFLWPYHEHILHTTGTYLTSVLPRL